MVYWKEVVQMALYILLLLVVAGVGVAIGTALFGKSGFRSEEVCTSKRRGFEPYGDYPNYGM